MPILLRYGSLWILPSCRDGRALVSTLSCPIVWLHGPRAFVGLRGVSLCCYW